MLFQYHLKELQYRFLYLIFTWLLSWVILYTHKFYFLNLFFPNTNFIFTYLSEALISFISFTFFLSMFLIIPNLCYHIFEFLKPGLFTLESQKLKRQIKNIAILFYLFVSINWYFILPYFIKLLLYNNINTLLTFSPKISEYVWFLIIFTFSIILLLLSPLIFFYFVPPKIFSHYRFHIYFTITLFISLITPPDLILLLTSIILIILYFELILLFKYLLENITYPLSTNNSP